MRSEISPIVSCSDCIVSLQQEEEDEDLLQQKVDRQKELSLLMEELRPAQKVSLIREKVTPVLFPSVKTKFYHVMLLSSFSWYNGLALSSFSWYNG